MCTWFSCNTRGDGKLLYFNAKQRDQICKGELRFPSGGGAVTDPDSHTSIAMFFGGRCDSDDRMNKYEFRPLDRYFQVDQINVDDDSSRASKAIRRLDFERLAPPELVWKSIVNPLTGVIALAPSLYDKRLLRKWDSVGNSVGASVGDSVRDSVRASVWGSVRASVWGSVWAYVGSFFSLPRSKWKYTGQIPGRGYPFACAARLWERGFVPVVTPDELLLCAGPNADIVYCRKK